MDYLLLEILLFLILAAVIGFFTGWISRGQGFESRLLTSENQWRSRHHALQGENNRLKSELDSNGISPAIDEDTGTTQAIQNDDIALSLPFKSSRDKEPSLLSNTVTSEGHPLERLRGELNQIEKSHTGEPVVEEQISEQVRIFEEEDPELFTAPASLDQPVGEADDLKTIKGIGPKIESTLNNIGIYHFSQIADFSEDNISWINNHLRFSGRIEREEWIEQARKLINESDA